MPSNNGTQTGTATSRARQARRATRKATKARLALSGPSGSGKTWTALSIAEVLAPDGPVCVIDTEPADNNQGAATLYADRFTFDTIEWAPPYDPRDLAVTIEEVAREYEVVILDSASHFWRGEGGTLDIADGRFGGWKTATPAQEDMIEAILRAPAHVIVCTRAKQSYEVSESIEGGQKKQKVEKLGLAPIQRDDMEYEFQVVAMIDVEHRIDIGKTRCHDLAGKSFHANDQAKFAEVYAKWLMAGVQLMRQAEVDVLMTAFDVVDDKTERAHRKREFLAEFGDPRQVAEDRAVEVWKWLSGALGIPDHPFDDTGDDTTACAYCGLHVLAGWHDFNAPRPPTRQTAPEPAAAPEGGNGASDPVAAAPGAPEGVSGHAEPPAGTPEPAATPVDAAGHPLVDPNREPTPEELEAAIAQVTHLSKREVVEALRVRNQPTSGNEDTLRARLTKAVLTGVPVQA